MMGINLNGKSSFFLFALLLIFSACHSQSLAPEFHSTNRPYVLLISLDGFRHDYIDEYQPPNLLKFRKAGAFAKKLEPVFPSLTFTNHYSIVTGLYAENHGIVANIFYDPIRQTVFSLGDKKSVTDGSWYNGLPLWVAAERQGMHSACYFWPGSEAEIHGTRPKYFKPYDQSISSKDRIEQIVDWLKLPELDRPHFLTLYFSLADSAGHEFGPISPQVKNAVLQLDADLGDLFQKLDQLKLPLNILIVSDHGMTASDPKRVVELGDLIDSKKFIIVEATTQVSLFAKEEMDLSLLIQQWRKHLPGTIHVYKREDIPESLHIKNNPRIGDILIFAEPPYTLHIAAKSQLNKGVHGYSPKYSDMGAIFLAKGPQIRSEIQLEKIKNIEIYSLIAKILGLQNLEKANGAFQAIKKMYKE